MAAEVERRIDTWCYEHGCPINDCASIHIEDDYQWRQTWEQEAP